MALRPDSAASAAALLFAALCLAACTRPSSSLSSPPLEWRLVPESTVSGDRRQFFVYGSGLEGAQVTADSSVRIEQGGVKPDGKVLSLYLTVGPLRGGSGSLADERPGRRLIKVTTKDSVVAFPLKIVDEK